MAYIPERGYSVLIIIIGTTVYGVLPQVVKGNGCIHTAYQYLGLLLVEHSGLHQPPTARIQTSESAPKPLGIDHLRQTLKEGFALQFDLLAEPVV
jgi:hypothetical protein